MAVFTWNDKFSVSVESMDKQHKYFLDLLNNLNDQIQQKNDDETVTVAMHKLFNYAAFHFRDEENILNATGFTGLKEQHRDHGFFMEQVKQMEESIKHGDRVQLGSVVSFLKDWFVNHIMSEDKKYAAYLKMRYASETLTLDAD